MNTTGGTAICPTGRSSTCQSSASDAAGYVAPDRRIRGVRVSSRWLVLPALVLLLLCAGCATPGAISSVGTKSAERGPSATATALASTASLARFTFSGGQSASYTLRAPTPTSELRHGHREFTIILSDANLSLFIVFYGYQGPGNYTLADTVNGGDVHIGLEHDTISWDLLMQPTAHCFLTVTSDTPTSSPGIDRMQGSFACPLLFSSSPRHPQKPVQVSAGSFDIAILVAS
jgi:hypothetical protein